MKIEVSIDDGLVGYIELYAYQRRLSFEGAVEKALSGLVRETDLCHWCTFCGFPNCEAAEHSREDALASVLRGETVVYRWPETCPHGAEIGPDALDSCPECGEESNG